MCIFVYIYICINMHQNHYILTYMCPYTVNTFVSHDWFFCSLTSLKKTKPLGGKTTLVNPINPSTKASCIPPKWTCTLETANASTLIPELPLIAMDRWMDEVGGWPWLWRSIMPTRCLSLSHRLIRKLHILNQRCKWKVRNWTLV